MEIIEVSPKEYAEIIAEPYHVFGSSGFNRLNEKKCEKVHYLLFREGKYRLGIIGGIRENTFLSPFSSPFGGFSFLSSKIRLQFIEEALSLLAQWAKEKQLHSISITLPPAIYGSSFIAKQVNCLWRGDYRISQVDLNYSYNLLKFDETYMDSLWYNARKNLRIALDAGLKFITCDALDEKKTAYEIIQENRRKRGFPLRMTWQQVKDTSEIIPADFFLVKDPSDRLIASAIVFHVAPGIVQVIYWGDLPEYSAYKTMNFLSYSVFEFYSGKGIERVDIGPSTEHSVPNHGLAEFKESIGCDIHPKYSFSKQIV